MKRKARGLPVLHVAERTPAYLARPPIVIDCSVLCALLFEEPTRDAAGTLLVGKTLHAPLLLDGEIVSVATKKQRAGAPPALRRRPPLRGGPAASTPRHLRRKLAKAARAHLAGSA